MISLADIFPVTSIYLGSGYAVLLWLLPLAVGKMLYHFLSRHWKRATFWLLVVIFIPSLVLAGVFALGLEKRLYAASTIMLTVTCLVMLGQAVLWRTVWLKHRKSGAISPWRTIAPVAFVVSLILAFLALGCFYTEWRTVQHESTRYQQEATEDQDHLNKVGYVPYPGADYPYGDCMIRGSGGAGESLSVQFRTSDEPQQVLDFYQQCAESAGLLVRVGTRRHTDVSSLVAMGDGDVAMELEHLPTGEWVVTIYWDTPEDFGKRIERSHDLEGS